MADEENRSFAPSDTQVNRSRAQGLGVGQTEIDRQNDPNRFETATEGDRTERFDDEVREATNSDRPGEADFGDTDLRPVNGGGQAGGDGGEAVAEEANAARRDAWGLDPNVGRDEAGINAVEGDLGAGTPANVDIHKLGQEDNPEEDWGEPADEGTMFSSTNTNRGGRTELERGQGAKTRQHNKDMFSRRT